MEELLPACSVWRRVLEGESWPTASRWHILTLRSSSPVPLTSHLLQAPNVCDACGTFSSQQKSYTSPSLLVMVHDYSRSAVPRWPGDPTRLPPDHIPEDTRYHDTPQGRRPPAVSLHYLMMLPTIHETNQLIARSGLTMCSVNTAKFQPGCISWQWSTTMVEFIISPDRILQPYLKQRFSNSSACHSSPNSPGVRA